MTSCETTVCLQCILLVAEDSIVDALNMAELNGNEMQIAHVIVSLYLVLSSVLESTMMPSSKLLAGGYGV